MKEKENKRQLVRDPVCGMWIEPDDAADMEIYKGKIFYFCAPCCKKDFEENPEPY
ncbi:MAG: YHS domain-containing protein, partial [Ignavibacteria bacterium]|nr:YHS domain-containing protein [Ignavibacteria bacterium]